MNGTQLIWVVLLTFTFIVAILTTPILLLTSNSQNNTTNNSGNTTDSCPEEFTGYCMNGGYCFHLKEQQQSRVNVRNFMVEKGVKIFYGLLENARGKCLHQMFN